MPKAPLYNAHVPRESWREWFINSAAPVLFVIIAISLTVVVGLPLYLIFSFVDIDAQLPTSENSVLKKGLVGGLVGGSFIVFIMIYRKCQDLFENWRRGKHPTSGG